MNSREIIDQININSSGEISKTVIINDRSYLLNCEWKRNIYITISPKDLLLTETGTSEIRKLPFISIIVRSPQYSLRGEKTKFTEKLLTNQYTRALLYFPASKISCENNKISYTARLKKRNSGQLELILNYFTELVNTL